MTDRKIFIVVNPFAGARKKAAALRDLGSFLESRDVPFEIFDTQDDKNATKTVARNLDQQFTDLLIVGGDGTINEAINGLAFDIPVSIIPSGTGNDFVKNVNLGKTRAEQFETAINGAIKKIDLGKCNDRIFLNGVGIGFDGQIVEDMVAKRVPFLSGHAAYYYHVLRILGSYKERPFDYRIDDRSLSKELILLAIGNGTTFGGGFRLMPNAKIDDGLFEVCEIGKLSAIRRFMNIHRLSKGTHDALDAVNLYTAKRIEVIENPLLFAHADGEWMGQPPLEIKVLPNALSLRVASTLP